MIMFSCKEASRLASEGLDRKLSLTERLELRAHLLICGACRRYRRQLLALARLVKERGADGIASSGEVLSKEARDKIRSAMRHNGAA